ncbi:MAG: radical SAM protein [Oscillospiraceae bacterium]|nr:radical SAM protein [Oscillospiraceae bacterium]
MRTIKQPNKKVAAFIGTKHPSSSTGWRLSLWTVPFEEDGVYLLKHTFSGETVSLNAEEFADPLSIPELRERRFVVPSDYDEAAKYTEILGLMKLMQRESSGIMTYTILPTTACNARCTYCYEEGFAVSTMKPDTAKRLVDYICETCGSAVTLSWFGGEPLVGAETITYVCTELEKRGVKFRSRMVTNASLFDDVLVHRAKQVWKLTSVQVSLDGDRRDYAARKRYTDPVRFNYDKVIQSVHMLSDEGISVNLRVNFDYENIDRLQGFLDDMNREFGARKNVSIYLSPLYQEMKRDTIIDLERRMYELDGYIRRLGINFNNRGKIRTSFRMNFCMAGALDRSIVIDPEGRFSDCEHLPEAHTWGNIFDGITDRALLDRLSAPHDVDEGCKLCPYLPQCTPFYRHGCPCWFAKCREHMALKNEYELRLLADIERNGSS